MKKVLIILVSFISLFALTACGEKSSDDTSSSSTSASLPSLSGQLPTDKVQEKEKTESASNLALQNYIEKVMPQIEEIKAQVVDVYSDITLVQDDAHSMTITYIFKNQYTLSDEDLNTVKDNFKDLNRSLLTGMTNARVVNPSLHVVYKLPDGTVVIDEPFTETQ